MAERGASGGGSGGDSLDKSITLPPDEIFRNLENAKRFAIDIGRHGPGTQESGRSSGRGRPASGGGGKDEGRGRGPCAQPHGSPHSLSGLIVCAASRCGTERAVGLQLPVGAARLERGTSGLVVRAAPVAQWRDGRGGWPRGPSSAQSPPG